MMIDSAEIRKIVEEVVSKTQPATLAKCESNPTPKTCQACGCDCTGKSWNYSLDGVILSTLCMPCMSAGAIWAAKQANDKMSFDQFKIDPPTEPLPEFDRKRLEGCISGTVTFKTQAEADEVAKALATSSVGDILTLPQGMTFKQDQPATLAKYFHRVESDGQAVTLGFQTMEELMRYAGPENFTPPLEVESGAAPPTWEEYADHCKAGEVHIVGKFAGPTDSPTFREASE